MTFTYFAGGQNVLDLKSPADRALAIRHSRPFPGDARGMAVGDFDGDGDADLAIASFAGSAGAPNGLYYSIQIVLGDGTRGAPVDLDALPPGQGVTIWTPRYMGLSKVDRVSCLESGGDVNGDGIWDLVLSASIHGSAEWDVLLGLEEYPREATLSEMVDLWRLTSTLPSFDTGSASRIVPDLDGDGLDDLLLTGGVSQPRAERHLYIVRGRRAPPGVVDLSTVAQDGLGALHSTRLGLSLAAGAAGDFNGDGRSDVFFAGPGRFLEGAVLVLYGGDSMFPGVPVVLGADHVRDTGGLLVTGAALFSGVSFSAAVPGDLDGDGKNEVFLGLDNAIGCTLTPGSGLGFVLDREAILRRAVHAEEYPLVGQLYGDEPTGLPDAVVGSAASPEGFRPRCLDALDADDDGVILITDAIFLLSYLFLGGQAPPEPFATSGLDPTPDGLSCGA